MAKARIRGIYSTALTKLLDNDFEIVQPSAKIKEKLSLKKTWKCQIWLSMTAATAKEFILEEKPSA